MACTAVYTVQRAALTVNVDDGESAEGDSSATAQLATNQLYDLVDLTVAL